MLMTATRETRDVPAIQDEFNVPRFLWELMAGWHQRKGKASELQKYYREQQTKMEQFDKKHPGQCPPPEMPLPIGQQPRFPIPPQAVMMAKGQSSSQPPPKKPVTGNNEKPRALPLRTPGPASLPPKKPDTDDSEERPAEKKPGPAKVPKRGTKVVDTDEDKDADGSVDEQVPVSKPEKVHKLVPASGHIRRQKTETEEESSEDEVVPVIKPAKSRKPVSKTMSDENWATSTDEEERKARKKRKGKSRQVDESEPEPEPKKKQPPADEGETRKKRPVVKSTGEVKEIACVRCARGRVECYKQAGDLQACVKCAKLKMKCVPGSGEVVGSTQPVRKLGTPATPAPGPSALKKPAKKITTGDSTVPEKRPAGPATEEPKGKRIKVSTPAPAVSGGRKKFKSAEVIETSEDESDEDESGPAPAPAPSGKPGSRPVPRPKSGPEPGPSARPASPPPVLPDRPGPSAPLLRSESGPEPGPSARPALAPRVWPDVPAPSSPLPAWPHSVWPDDIKNFAAIETYYSEFLLIHSN